MDTVSIIAIVGAVAALSVSLFTHLKQCNSLCCNLTTRTPPVTPRLGPIPIQPKQTII